MSRTPADLAAEINRVYAAWRAQLSEEGRRQEDIMEQILHSEIAYGGPIHPMNIPPEQRTLFSYGRRVIR